MSRLPRHQLGFDILKPHDAFGPGMIKPPDLALAVAKLPTKTRTLTMPADYFPVVRPRTGSDSVRFNGRAEVHSTSALCRTS